MATLLANLPAKTGKTLAEWFDVVGATGLRKHGEIVEHLKTTCGVSHGYANQIALRFLAGGSGADVAPAAPAANTLDDAVAWQYAGAKAGLLPIYEAVAEAVRGFGPDVELAPKKAYVSLRRHKQFAIVQPSTATRLDLGIQLPALPPGARLEASGSFNAMLSHRVRVASAAEVDAELIAWLRQAYDQA
jgi:hypothetical protein